VLRALQTDMTLSAAEGIVASSFLANQTNVVGEIAVLRV
jgi:hypothetical protein